MDNTGILGIFMLFNLAMILLFYGLYQCIEKASKCYYHRYENNLYYNVYDPRENNLYA